MAAPLRLTDTTLRDAHQSLWATRMRTEDMLPVAEMLDRVGYHSLEVWGGATFDVCLRFLDEDPWERLRALRKAIKHTPLQMLLRGQSLVGYKHYPDDVVEAFVRRAVANGIDIIRIFDALNDVRNLEKPIAAAKEAGAHVQATVVYTVSPIHTIDHYVATARRLAELGADSLCLKDMAGLLAPYRAYELVRRFKEEIGLPVQLHSHYIGGLAPMTYLKAAEAGVDVVDTASAPMAFGASQPPAETLASALRGTERDPGLDLDLLFEVARYFDDLRRRRGFERGVTRISDMRVFSHQVPGGMISNLVTQLEQQKALDRLQDVLAEIPRVREDLGYPPLVTPTSQIVGTQAVLNVLAGARYKVVPDEVKAYARGLYGQPPAPLSPEIRRILIGDAEVISCRPADLLPPGLEKARLECGAAARSEEDVLSYALFPQIARKYLLARAGQGGTGVTPAAEQVAASGQAASTTKEVGPLNIKEIKELIKLLNETDIAELNVESEGVKVSIKKAVAGVAAVAAVPAGPAISPRPAAPVEELSAEAKEEPGEVVLRENQQAVCAPMVGTFYRAPSPDADPFVKEGDVVEPGQPLCIIEAMKLMNEIEAEVRGRVERILVENAQPVEYGQPLFILEKLP
ncbi:MAG TPA: acetyl-CoA carboxylase biotin carboxyl carrier protein [Firmicutes bacterium]|nr:acetyl-CoA carboxylase biotin carboxyl carrier protein [Bacillota bacterium]